MIPSAVGQYVLCFRRCAYISTDPCIHPLQVWLSTGRVSTLHTLWVRSACTQSLHIDDRISAPSRFACAPAASHTYHTHPAGSCQRKALAFAYFQLQLCCIRSLYFPFVQHRQGRVTACFYILRCHAPCRRPRRARLRRAPRRHAFSVRGRWQPFFGTSRTAPGSNFGLVSSTALGP